MIDIIIGVLPYIAAMLVAVLFFAVYRGGLKKQAKQLLLCLVNTAEQTYGGGCGKLKYSAVASKLYEMMPKLFKFIFSEKMIANMIEKAVADMKEFLCDGDDGQGKEAQT
ncbi:MAG: phage holin, LLH family [Clostridia bacterium]|nr:phage holin, LLH family [Clostridia bacterium]